MSAVVTLTVVEEGRRIKELNFHSRTIGIVGRGSNCYIQLPGDLMHQTISRHHCLLDIEPPKVRVQDLGSRNGTFVNGVNIGPRSPDPWTEETIAEEGRLCALKDGDELRVGDTIFRVASTADCDAVREDPHSPAGFPETIGEASACEPCGS